MPRSNKKKHPNNHSVVQPGEEASIAQLLNEEKVLMISRAIVSIFLKVFVQKIYLNDSRQVLRDKESN